MRRTLLIVFLLAIMAAGGLYIGPHIAANKGYVLIAWQSYTIEMTAISAALIVLAVWIGLWFLKKLLKSALGLVSGSRNWLSGRSQRRLQQAFRSGLIALNEGNLEQARTQLKKATGADFSGLNYLALAQVERQLGHEDKAIEAWQNARNNNASVVAASIQLSRHYLSHQQPDEALLILAQLNNTHQVNPQVIEQYAQALVAKKQWVTLSKKLNDWKKHLSKDQLQRWQEHAAQGTYAEIASKEGAYQLKAMWEQQPRKARADVANQVAYVKQLLSQSMYQDAEAALVSFQKKVLINELFPLFKTLRLPNPTASIKLIESWLKKDPDNPELLSTLGYLAYQAGDFELAEKVLRKAMSLRNDKHDVLLLAKVKENQHDSKGALALYKQCTFD
ncbi:heme biosynthesis HemY N-terminal domain-containing protein [Alteromonas sp. a30]|uniref:heme biosynthesis HemY N-terminal domain-containing protein n=1 Tax=Alteromonas sp. a30 TaxID=2730917 RepID=UPI0022819548|nr:heme biosynthesis HemY N-terminal domain-containing protein [Alteromonas sp. a30]MCY7296259.1 heme biosynthesis protein HemY [Alteromonas sp. a30]